MNLSPDFSAARPYPERPLDPPTAPRVPRLDGHQLFVATIGDADVEVFTLVDNGQLVPECTQVMYRGVDIAPTLVDEQWAAIGHALEDHARAVAF